MKPIILKDNENKSCLPVTHSDLVYVNGTTLTEKLNTLGNGSSINDSQVSTQTTYSSDKIVKLNQSASGKPHTGKTIAMLGDSIMTVVDTAVISSRTGMTVDKTNAHGGSSVALRSNVNMTEWDAKALCTISRSGNTYSIPIENFDYAMIFIGTNDWGHQHPIGTVDSTDEKTILGAYNVAIQNFITRKPNIKLLIATPMYRDGANTPTNGYLTLSALGDEIEKLGKKFGIPVLKMMDNGMINQYNKAAFLNADMLHPNSAGTQMFTHKFASFISGAY